RLLAESRVRELAGVPRRPVALNGPDETRIPGKSLRLTPDIVGYSKSLKPRGLAGPRRSASTATRIGPAGRPAAPLCRPPRTSDGDCLATRDPARTHTQPIARAGARRRARRRPRRGVAPVRPTSRRAGERDPRALAGRRHTPRRRPAAWRDP